MSRASAGGSARLPALDGVRALSVIGVIASHSGLFNLGWLGVDVFFGLSGYLITGILLDARASAPPARAYFIPFYMRRALRILPLAWVVAVIVASIHGQWGGLPWYMGYLVNWRSHATPPRELGHYWSLAVEEQFYLIWPAIVFWASPRALWRITLSLIACDVAARLGFSLWRPEFATDRFLGLATFARADTLAVGALLAQRERGSGWGREKKWALPVAIATGALVFLIRAVELMRQPSGVTFPPPGKPADPLMLLTYNLKWPMIALFVGAALLYVLVRPPRWLEWRWLAWIGQVSYGVYIIHALFGGWLHQQFTHPLVIFFAQLGVTLPLAAVSWYLFEAPILKHKRHWPMPEGAVAGAPTAAATALEPSGRSTGV